MTSPLPTFLYPEERRYATVLFADVQGFTALSEKYDFETLSNLIKDVWLKLDTVIEAHGGFIDKHIGDAVMAVWGAPYAGENDAERAVTTGLAVQEAMKEFAIEFERPGAGELRIRVGINTGLVLSGYVGLRNEYTVMGDTVNVSNRLENFAEAGTVVISDATFRLVRGIFQVRRLATPLQLKGKTEPVQAYLVDGVMPQPSRLRYRSSDSLETCMVGREVEMERLTSLYQQAVQSDQPTMVLVTGEAGLGKSRLLMEFTSSLEVNENGVTLMSARSLAQASQVPFFLWKSLWYLRFGLQDSDPSEVAREKFMREVQRLWGFQLGPASSVEAAHLIGSLIGLSWPESTFLMSFENNPQGRVKRAFELTRELLRRICAYRPTVILFDDLQWADNSSLELLAYLFEPADLALQLMILGGARLEFARQHPQYLNIAYILQLEPLPVEPGIVGAAYPDLRTLPDEVLLEIADRADGNPYFMEEMAKSLVKAGMNQESLSTEDMLNRLHSNPPEVAAGNAAGAPRQPDARGACRGPLGGGGRAGVLGRCGGGRGACGRRYGDGTAGIHPRRGHRPFDPRFAAPADPGRIGLPQGEHSLFRGAGIYLQALTAAGGGLRVDSGEEPHALSPGGGIMAVRT